MIVRLATQQDSDAVEKLLVDVYGESERKLASAYLNCMFSDDYRKPDFIVAERDGEIIGTASFSEELFTVGTWGISWVAVREDMRNQKTGQILIETCLSEIKNKAKKTVTVILGTYPDKTSLYEKVGFEKGWQDHGGGWFMFKTLEGA